jgi:hypothetical protein
VISTRFTTTTYCGRRFTFKDGCPVGTQFTIIMDRIEDRAGAAILQGAIASYS